MANIWVISLIIVGVLVGMTFFRDGAETIKTDPLGSTLESGQIAFNTGQNIVQWGSQQFNSGENVENINLNKTRIDIGQIPCATNEDCVLLDACNGITCFCDNVQGICYKEE